MGDSAAHEPDPGTCAGTWTPRRLLDCEPSMLTLLSQLRSIFDNTGTNRQSDLVRLLIAASIF